jgi:hypothetical protein
MLTKWNLNIKGISVVQHFPLEASQYTVGDRIKEICDDIQKMERNYNSPVLVVVNLKNNPSEEFAHTIKGSSVLDPKRLIPILSNALQKYPMTEKILIEGGSDIVLVSSKEFGVVIHTNN